MDEHLERPYLEDELYEKVVVRERRRKGLLITLAFILFLFLCGIPVYNERFPKWESLRAAKNIAVEIEKMKTESLHLKKPLQISVQENGQIKVEAVADCVSGSTGSNQDGGQLYGKNWKHPESAVTILAGDEAKKLKLAMVVQQICFDPVTGMHGSKTKKVFIIVPVKDLTEARLDRASYVEVTNSSASIAIN